MTTVLFLKMFWALTTVSFDTACVVLVKFIPHFHCDSWGTAVNEDVKYVKFREFLMLETEVQEMCDLTVKRAGRRSFAPEKVRQVELSWSAERPTKNKK